LASTAPAAVNPYATPATGGRSYAAPLAVLTSLFFMWGLITSLNDVIIPHFKAVFDLGYFQAMFVQTAFFTAYFVVSLPSGRIVNRIGYKTGIIVGLLVAGLGCVCFYPAAALRSYGLFLGALFILGSGITLLQVAANPFVAVLGKPETASSRLTMTQALNSAGTYIGPRYIGPMILSLTVLGEGEVKKLSSAALQAYRDAQASAVQVPYLGLAAALVVLAVAIGVFKLPKIEAPAEASDAATAGIGTDGHSSAWGYRHLVLGAVGIFVYVGAEVAIGSFLVNYFKEPSIGGLAESEGTKMVALYWGGAMVGRFVGTFSLRYFRPGRVLTVHALMAALLVIATMVLSGAPAMWTVLAVGLFNSIMFPTIFTLALDGLGKHTNQGSGILCMAIVGGALIPPIQGKLADIPGIGIHHCFIIPVVCYLYIAWYGVVGHPAKRAAAAVAPAVSA
jgi:FHS family L-fucose permease-like MFS transporter